MSFFSAKLECTFQKDRSDGTSYLQNEIITSWYVQKSLFCKWSHGLSSEHPEYVHLDIGYLQNESQDIKKEPSAIFRKYKCIFKVYSGLFFFALLWDFWRWNATIFCRFYEKFSEDSLIQWVWPIWFLKIAWMIDFDLSVFWRYQ